MKKIAHFWMGRLTIVGGFDIVADLLAVSGAVEIQPSVYLCEPDNPRCGDCSGACDCEQVRIRNKLSWTFLISVVADPWNHAVFPVWTLRSDEAHQRTDGCRELEVDACMPVDEEAGQVAAGGGSIGFDDKSKYIADHGDIFPVYRNTATKYYESGEAMFPICLQRWRARNTLFFWSISSSRRDICSPDRGYPEKKVKEGLEVA